VAGYTCDTTTNRCVAAAGVDAAAGGVDAGPDASYQEVVRADRPLAYWRFEEPSGSSVAKDELGHHPATYVGKPALGVPGIAGGFAVDLGAANRPQVQTNSDAFRFKGNAQLTIEVWVSPRSLAGYGRIASNEDVATGDGWYITAGDAGDGLAFAFHDRMSDAGNFARYVSWDGQLAQNRFHHVVFAYDSTTVYIWIDGVQLPPAQQPRPAPDTGLLTWGCRIVEQSSTLVPVNCADATFDEAAIYDHPLNDAQVQAHWEKGRPR
jgi:hypothetical protein